MDFIEKLHSIQVRYFTRSKPSIKKYEKACENISKLFLDDNTNRKDFGGFKNFIKLHLKINFFQLH